MRKLLLSIILLFCFNNVVFAENSTGFSRTAFFADSAFPGLRQTPWLTHAGVDFSYFDAVISSQPADLAVCDGANAAFTVSATDATAYKWQVNTGPGFTDVVNAGVYSNAGTNTLTITGAGAAMDTYKYRCVVSGSSGPDVISSEATLRVFSAPLNLIFHPVNRTICVGSTTTFEVTAGNAGTFQWQANDGSGFVNISDTEAYTGTNRSILTITSAATAGMNGYQYRCIITGPCSAVPITSNSASLSINIPPFITTNISSQTVCGGTNVTFSIVSPNAGSYQWQVDQGSGFANVPNAAPYSGVTSANLKITAATSSLSGFKYRCVITGACLPTVTSSIATLTVNSIDVVQSQSDVSCNAGVNGAASVSVSGGSGNYSYDWTPGNPAGDGTASVNGLVAGTYSVAITDITNACTTTKSFTITQPAALGATQSQTNISCKGASTGSATVTASGGTSGYTYSWSPSGGTAATATGLSVGDYTVTITDAKGCTTAKSFTITEPAELSITESQTNVSCKGDTDGSATVIVTGGGTGPYAYSWSPSGGSAATATGLAAGNHAVTITDGNGCQTIKNFIITEPVALSATAAQTNVSCDGGSDGSATVSVTGGTGAYTYSWFPSGGSNSTASGLTAGTYTVKITDANSCEINQSFTISQPTALNVTSSQTNISCNNGNDGSATVNVSGGTGTYRYDWFPSGGTGATASGLTAGTHTVTITDANNCTTSQSFTLTEPIALNVTASQTNISCYSGNDGSATVNVSGGSAGYTYSWAPSGGSAATASGLSAGSYTVTITDALGCKTTQDFTITQPAAFTALLSSKSDVSTAGGTDGSATVSATGGTSPYTYSWAPSGGTSATASGLASGTYTCTITDALGCTATVSVTITEVPVLTGFSAISKIYGDSPFAIVAPSSPSNGVFSYTSSNTQVASISGSTISILKAGTTTITATQAANGKYAEATATAVLTVTPRNISLSLNAVPAISKIYDGTTAASLQTANYSLNAVLTGDDVSVSGTATYDSNTAGTGKTITLGNIVLSGAQKDNYNLTTSSATSTGTISKKDITLTLNAAPLISREYDGTAAAVLATANYTLNDIISGDDVTISGNAVYDTKNAGFNKTVTVNALVIAGAQKDNYNLTSSTASTTGNISPKALSASAAAITKVYDGTTAATINFNAFTATDGLVSNDDVKASFTEASYDNKDAGTNKPVSFTALGLTGAQKDNYFLNAFSASGAITPRSVSVTANAAGKVYGDTDPELTYSITTGALAGGDSFSGSLTRSAGEATGTYLISQGTLALTNNYVLTFTGSNLQITKKELVISADNKTRFFGSVNPALTLSYAGFVYGEDHNVLIQQPAVSSNADINSPLGDYPIIVSGASATNYSIIYSNGILKVIPGTPNDITLAAAALFENRPAGSLAGMLGSASDDANATFSFSLVSGAGDTDNSLFSISGEELKTTASLDFDSKSSYQVRVRSTTQHGFLFEKVISILINDVNEIPTLNPIADQTVCYSTAPLTITLSGISPGPEGSRQSTTSTAVSSNNSLFSDLKVVGDQVSYRIAKGRSGSATITVTVKDNGGTNNGGVDTYSRTFNLTVKNPLQMTISSDKGTSIHKGETLRLTATGGVKYSWMNANGIVSGQETETLTVRPSETTTYKVRVTNSEGCDDVQEFTVETTEDLSLVRGANILTPNGDGVNDRLVIKNIDMYPNSELKIYDRAGRLLYSKTNYNNDWDGTFQGSALAEDSYYYIVDFGPGKWKQKGFITIIRD